MRTIKNGDLPATPLANGADGTPWLARDLGNPEQIIGFTKREELSARFMAAMLSNPTLAGELTDRQVARIACEQADTLLAEWQQ